MKYFVAFKWTFYKYAIYLDEQKVKNMKHLNMS